MTKTQTQQAIDSILEYSKLYAHALGHKKIETSMFASNLGFRLKRLGTNGLSSQSVKRVLKGLRSMGFDFQETLSEEWVVRITIDMKTIPGYTKFITKKIVFNDAVAELLAAARVDPETYNYYIWGDMGEPTFSFTPVELAALENVAKQSVVKKLKESGLSKLCNGKNFRVETKVLDKVEEIIIRVGFTVDGLHQGLYQKFVAMGESLKGYKNVEVDIAPNFELQVHSIPESLMELDEAENLIVQERVKSIAQGIETKLLVSTVEVPYQEWLGSGLKGIEKVAISNELNRLGFKHMLELKSNGSPTEWVHIQTIPTELVGKVEEAKKRQVWVIGEISDGPIKAKFVDLPIRTIYNTEELDLITEIKNGRKVVFANKYIIPDGFNDQWIPLVGGFSVWVVSEDNQLVEYKAGQTLPETIFNSAYEESTRVLLMHTFTDEQIQELKDSGLLPQTFISDQVINFSPEQQAKVDNPNADYDSVDSVWYAIEERDSIRIVLYRQGSLPDRTFSYWMDNILKRTGIKIFVLNKCGSWIERKN